MTRRDFISLLGAAVTLCSNPTPGQQLGTAMTVAAKRATATIPIVMAPVADPLRAGIVTNHAHPGGNVTGTALRFGACGQARGRFQASGSGISRIAVLGAGASPVTRVLWPETQNAVQSLRLEARLFTVHDPAELSATFETIAQDNANGILVAQFCEEDHHRARGEASPARDL